jgi:hypothetical protein
LDNYLYSDSKHEKELSDGDRRRLCFELFSGSFRFFVFASSAPFLFSPLVCCFSRCWILVRCRFCCSLWSEARESAVDQK